MTECSPVISTTVSWNIRKGSVGQLLPNCEARTVNEELWVRGSSVMQGYYKMPEETAEALSRHFLKQRPFRLPVPVFSQTEAFPAPRHCFFTEKHSFLPLITEKY